MRSSARIRCTGLPCHLPALAPAPSCGRHPESRCGRTRGFSLVELLVAIAIGLVIVAATSSMLVTSNRSNAELARSGQINESGRFALQILSDRVSQAGFWGGWIPAFDDLTTSGAPTDYPAAYTDAVAAKSTDAIPDPCKTYANWSDQYKMNVVGIAVQAYDAAPSGCTLIVADRQPGTDVLVVRGVEPCVAGSTGCTAPTAAEVFLQKNRCTSSSATYALSAASADLTLQKLNCLATADRFRYVSAIFYVRNYSATAGDGIPTLMMSEFRLSGGTIQHNPAQALIPGIQGFRVELGIDNLSKSGGSVNQSVAVAWANATNLTNPTNRGDGLADTWVTCTTASPCTLAQLTNVVAVRLHLLVRSETTTSGYTDNKTYTLASSSVGPFNDGFRRRVYSQTVRVQNVAIRRETP